MPLPKLSSDFVRSDVHGRNSRSNTPVTKTGALRGQRCKAILGDWRRAKNLDDHICKNNPLTNGFCSQHQFLYKQDTRGQKKALDKYRKIGEGKKVTPVEAMATLISESAGNVDYLREEVRNLERLVISGRKTREEIAGMVLLYNEERDRHERFVTDAIRIRLDERKQELEESQAKVLVSVAKAIIQGIGLMGEDRKRALEIAAEQLRIAGANPNQNLWDGPLQEAAKEGPVEIIEANYSIPATKSEAKLKLQEHRAVKDLEEGNLGDFGSFGDESDEDDDLLMTKK